MQWPGDYDSQRTATFSALEDSRAAWISDVLEAAGFDPTRASKRVQLRPTETTRFLEWIGEPVPGVLYKWAPTRALYEGTRADVNTAANETDPSRSGDSSSRTKDVSLASAIDALETVAPRVDGPLTARAYDDHRGPEHPAASTIANKFGWSELKREAGI